jgi:hypothetical protein
MIRQLQLLLLILPAAAAQIVNIDGHMQEELQAKLDAIRAKTQSSANTVTTSSANTPPEHGQSVGERVQSTLLQKVDAMARVKVDEMKTTTTNPALSKTADEIIKEAFLKQHGQTASTNSTNKTVIRTNTVGKFTIGNITISIPIPSTQKTPSPKAGGKGGKKKSKKKKTKKKSAKNPKVGPTSSPAPSSSPYPTSYTYAPASSYSPTGSTPMPTSSMSPTSSAMPTAARVTQSPTVSAPPTANPTGSPTRSPTGSPTGSPIGSPTGSPTLVIVTKGPTVSNPVAAPHTTPTRRCSPTVGRCVSSAKALSRVLRSLSDGNTVSLCGDSTINTDTVLEIDASSTKLCCQGTNCKVQSKGEDSILTVFGNSVTIQDIIFLDGVSNMDGGNVGIFGSGNHRIVGSSFRNGVSGALGGNLYIATEGTVTIEDSDFIDGTAAISGGGVAIETASAVTVINSRFIGNLAPKGGGFYSTRSNPESMGQMITISDSNFMANSGQVGGGVYVETLGKMPMLSILSSDFSDNSASIAGGAGTFVEYLTNLNLVLKSNKGQGNVGSQLCGGFLGVSNKSNTPVCVQTTQKYPY